MAGGIVTLGQVDVVVLATFYRLVQRNWWAQELFLNLAETVKAGLELEVVVAVTLSNCGDYGNVVALRADVVR